ncbi:MAG: hypothetical protein HOH58_15305 [Opitutaceae bacterium]|jgi:hypothetical protein|nr:hypothetical protein [Opitutaceae bacterium]
MKILRIFFTLFLVVPLSSSAQLFSKKPKKEPEILIVSDTFGHEEAAVRPSKENPVSYMIFIGQRRDMGATIAGIKAPTKEEIESIIHRTMQSQGFTSRALGEEVPDIFVVYTYGSAYVPDDPSEGIEFDEESGEFSGQTAVPDTVGEREMFALAGGAKVLQNGANRLEVEAVRDAAEIDRLFIMIAAVNGPKYHQGEKEVMWRTWISIPSRGFNLPNYLDLMVETAGPYLATETHLPVTLREEDRRETNVEIGETTVVAEEP